MPNKYFCSDGERVSEATIRKRLSEAYREKYAGEPMQSCFECGASQAQGSMHIIPKARLKSLHKTELIWDWEMFVPGCHICNTLLENVSSPEFKKLNGYEYYVEIFRKYDRERWMKSI
jgi:hypothetical protein